MKTRKDPRHINRIKVMQDLFAWDFNHKSIPETDSAPHIIDDVKALDNLISQSAPAWPLNKINKIDLAILRQAAYELTKMRDIPPKVVVDEAVEIGKEYGSDSSPSFINGVLGKLMSLQNIST